MLPGPRHRGLVTFSLNWELGREHRVYGTLGKAYTNSAPDQHSLYSVGQHTRGAKRCCYPAKLTVIAYAPYELTSLLSLLSTR